MKRKPLLVIGLVSILLLGVFASIHWILNPMLEKVLDRYAREKIRFLQETPAYRFNYEGLDIDIARERITLYDFSMNPLPGYREAFLRGETGVKSIKRLTVNEVTIEGVSLLNFLWDKSIEVRSIRIDSATLDLLLSGLERKEAKKPSKSVGEVLKGIRLPGFKKLSLGAFELGSFTLHQMNLNPGDTLLSFTSAGGHLAGLGIKKASDLGDSDFQLALEDLSLYLNEEKLELWRNRYSMGFEHLKYVFASQELEVRTLSFQPRENHESFRRNNTHSYEIYKARLKALKLVSFDLDGFLNNGEVSVAKMELDSLDLEIFRDKTRPYDTSRKKLLPNQVMVALDFPFTIDTLEARNSYLEYIELAEAGKDPLVLDFTNLGLTITNLTSMTEGLPDTEALELEMTGKLDNAIDMDVQIRLPYNTSSMWVSGRTEGTSDFASLNRTVLPAIGLQFKDGRVDGLSFDMHGTPQSLQGNLTLLYHNLDVEFYREGREKRNALSWATNALLKNSNPRPNGRTVVGEIQVQRVPYKGLGNYLWKGVESGLINSLNPFGSHRVVRK